MIKVATFSMAAFGWWGIPQEELASRLLTEIDRVGAEHPDLICLPEKALDTSGDFENPHERENTANFLTALCERAAQYRSYIACSLAEPCEEHPDKQYNTTYLIDRKGNVAGHYRKRHVTVRELEKGDLPSTELPVIDTDFGKVGILTCFDASYSDDWAELSRLGAKIVLWNAAYDGGCRIPAYAALHGYAVVTSVWTDRARIINAMGETIADNRGKHGVLVGDLEEDLTVYHTDFHEERIPVIAEKYEGRVVLRHYPDEDVFTLSSHDPTISVEDVEQEYRLTRYCDYAAVTQKQGREILSSCSAVHKEDGR
jgi:predicted amidohydrolase